MDIRRISCDPGTQDGADTLTDAEPSFSVNRSSTVVHYLQIKPMLRILAFATLSTIGVTAATQRHADARVALDASARVAMAGANAREPAIPADTFVNTIGFNAHFENHYTPYVTRFAEVKNLLVAAGVRHVRVGMLFRNPTYDQEMKELAAAGIHGLYVTQDAFTEAQIQQFPSLVDPSLEGIEAPNEPDNVSDPDWAQKCRTYQQALYSWIKGDPQIARYPVVGPSIIKKWTEIGDLSAYMDFANIHNYLDVFNPDTVGFGGKTPYGVYGSITYNTNIVKVTSGGKPVISTETGYGATVEGGMTSTNRPILDYRAQMRYIPRLFFEQYRHGIVRTYVYELIDKGGSGTFDNFGVLKGDLTPKPAYTALKSITTALADPGPAFSTKPLRLELTGDTANVHHLLMQKRSGQYVLAVWIEASSWRPHGGGDINVPDQKVNVTLAPSSTAAATLLSMNEDGTFAPRALAFANGRASIEVSDKISLITLSR